MDNLTHSLVGLTAAKAGLNRLSPYATAVCVVGANAPDADIVALVGGPWFYLQHHRGITHSIIGSLVLAVLIPILFWTSESIVARLRGRERRIKFKGLLLASLIATSTHTLFDWTNNYGVRPWLPWSGRWYYGDLVFIVDPWLWLSLGGASFLAGPQARWRTLLWAALAVLIATAIIVLPFRAGFEYPLTSRLLWVFGLIGIIVAHSFRVGERWGSAIAITALALVVVYWGALSVAHTRAVQTAQAVMNRIGAEQGEQVQRVAATPLLADPLGWRCLAETDRATYRFDVRLNQAAGNNAPHASRLVRYEQLGEELTPAMESIKSSYPVEVFLGFARFPVVQIERDCLGETFAQFADLRYTEPGAPPRGSFSLRVPLNTVPNSTR